MTGQRDASDPSEALITRIAELEAELAESRRQTAIYRRLIGDAFGGVWLIDAEARTTLINPRMAEMLGDEPEAAQGRPLTDYVFAEDLPLLAGLLERRKQGVREQHPFRLKRRDGTAVEVLFATNPLLDEGGHYIGAAAWVHDVTEAKVAEERLRAQGAELVRERDLLRRIVQYVPALVAYHDRDFVYQWVNPVYEKLLGRTHEEVVGRPLEAVFPEARESFIPIMARVRETGKPYVASSFPFRYTHGGEPRTMLWDLAFVPAYDASGALEGVLGFGVEVSDRVEKARLQQARIEDLERAARQRMEFMSVVSHELRTPLQVLMGYATILEQELAGPLSEEQRGYLRNMEQATKALARLVNGVLDVCQLAAGSFKLHPRAIDFDEVIAQASEEVRPQAEGRGQRLVCELGELPVIEGDDQRLHQVLTSLLENAIKFTPEGGAIALRARAEAGRVRVEVEDDGPGIAPEALSRLFEPFSQLDMGTTRQAGGVGVGLAIAKALVEAHGGEIGVESRVGCGSTFWLTLPSSGACEAEKAC